MSPPRLHRIEGIDPAVFRTVAASGAEIKGPRRLAAAMAGMHQPVSLVLDHLEAVTNRQSLDAVARPCRRTAGGLADRHWLTGRLAASGSAGCARKAASWRSRIDDLSMTHPEASSLLSEVGVELSEADVAELVRRTEGWPVGLYLAALAMKAGGSTSEIGATFTGDDRFMGDYLRSEFLDRVSRAEVLFLTRTSILDRMCGPLCDAVIGGKRSSTVLERLESRNLLVVPLDRRRQWFRYHQLFRELLLSELARREPANVVELHLRAATWCETNGQPEGAIEHAQQAGDADRVARLVLQLANPVWASGRGTTVMSWMEWFETNGLLERFPAIATHGALMHALAGRPASTERWAAAAERTLETGTLSDGNTIDGTLAYLRALLCRDGIEAMRRDSQSAWNGLAPESPYRATMLLTEALADLAEGDLDRADALFARAADAASRVGNQPSLSILLAERGIAAVERNDWTAAAAFAEQAVAIVRDGHYDEYWTSCLVFAWVGTCGVASR